MENSASNTGYAYRDFGRCLQLYLPPCINSVCKASTNRCKHVALAWPVTGGGP